MINWDDYRRIGEKPHPHLRRELERIFTVVGYYEILILRKKWAVVRQRDDLFYVHACSRINGRNFYIIHSRCKCGSYVPKKLVNAVKLMEF
jgi:hypothetical protein